MHGVVFTLFKQYVGQRHGADTWHTLLKDVGRADTIYVPTRIYPDTEIADLVAAAGRLAHRPADDVLEDFGVFIAPHLLNMYAALVQPEWRTMELLLNVEDTIHRVVRLKDPGADPPELRFSKLDKEHLRFEYSSKRRMAAMAIGIIKGIARHYGETVDIKVETRPDGSTGMLIRIAAS